jgi:hypothetical protein
VQAPEAGLAILVAVQSQIVWRPSLHIPIYQRTIRPFPVLAPFHRRWSLMNLRVVPFDQTRPDNARQIAHGGSPRVTMTQLTNDKHKEYVRYADYCLNMIGTKQDQEAHSINREMAAEWLKLADDVLRQSKRMG